MWFFVKALYFPLFLSLVITKFLLFVTFVAITTANAQEVLIVDPGIGTLNTAIDTYGGDRIYQLQAGKFYQLSALIENNGYHLQIIGEEPVGDGAGRTRM